MPAESRLRAELPAPQLINRKRNDMNFRSTRLIPAAGAMAVLWLAFLTAPQAVPQQKQKMAEEVFKNIQVLKGPTVADFLGTMGVMSAAVGFDCSECHANAGTDK